MSVSYQQPLWLWSFEIEVWNENGWTIEDRTFSLNRWSNGTWSNTAKCFGKGWKWWFYRQNRMVSWSVGLIQNTNWILSPSLGAYWILFYFIINNVHVCRFLPSKPISSMQYYVPTILELTFSCTFFAHWVFLTSFWWYLLCASGARRFST